MCTASYIRINVILKKKRNVIKIAREVLHMYYVYMCVAEYIIVNFFSQLDRVTQNSPANYTTRTQTFFQHQPLFLRHFIYSCNNSRAGEIKRIREKNSSTMRSREANSATPLYPDIFFHN